MAVSKLFNHSEPGPTSATEDMRSTSLEGMVRLNQVAQVKRPAQGLAGGVQDRRLKDGPSDAHLQVFTPRVVLSPSVRLDSETCFYRVEDEPSDVTSKVSYRKTGRGLSLATSCYVVETQAAYGGHGKERKLASNHVSELGSGLASHSSLKVAVAQVCSLTTS